MQWLKYLEKREEAEKKQAELYLRLDPTIMERLDPIFLNEDGTKRLGTRNSYRRSCSMQMNEELRRYELIERVQEREAKKLTWKELREQDEKWKRSVEKHRNL